MGRQCLGWLLAGSVLTCGPPRRWKRLSEARPGGSVFSRFDEIKKAPHRGAGARWEIDPGNYFFAAGAFFHNRGYGLLFIVGLLADAVLRLTGVM